MPEPVQTIILLLVSVGVENITKGDFISNLFQNSHYSAHTEKRCITSFLLIHS